MLNYFIDIPIPLAPLMPTKGGIQMDVVADGVQFKQLQASIWFSRRLENRLFVV